MNSWANRISMNVNKNWLILAAALVVGGLAALGAKNYLNSRINDIEAKEKNKETVKVVVSSAPLEKGVVLTHENMAVREIPKEWVHSGAVTPDQVSRVEGATLSYPANPGEPIIWSQLEGDHSATFSSMLSIGRRAVTVPVDEISSLSGMVEPGDLIDIVVSLQKDDKNYTFTLLQSVRVLATGRKVTQESKDKNGQAVTFSTITLDTTPEDAKRVISAREIGRITALLRAPGDTANISTSRADAAALLGLTGTKAEAIGISSVPVIYGGGPITEGLKINPSDHAEEPKHPTSTQPKDTES